MMMNKSVCKRSAASVQHSGGHRHLNDSGIRRSKKNLTVVMCIVMVLVFAIGGTFAYFIAKTDPKTNMFIAPEFQGDIPEEFDKYLKKNVFAKNVGEVDAYVRVKLMSRMVDADGNQVAIQSAVPEFGPGEGWVKYGEYYYYLYPVKVGEKTKTPLIGNDGVQLIVNEGYHQIIDVLAQYVQAEGKTSTDMPAVTEAWGIGVDQQTGALVFGEVN